MLARSLETAGFSTILVTMMPYWAEKVGVPRTLAVEFPFGQTLGQPGNVAQQMRVIREALGVLDTAPLTSSRQAISPGTIIHSEETWPVAQKEAYKAWQPPEPSPIIGELAPKFREMLRKSAREGKARK